MKQYRQFKFVLTEEELDSEFGQYLAKLAKEKRLTEEIKLAMKQRMNPVTQSPSTPSGGDSEAIFLERVAAKVIEVLDGYVPKSALVAAGIIKTGQETSIQPASQPGPRAIAAQQFALPVYDDEDQDTIVVNTVADEGGDISDMMATLRGMMKVDTTSDAYRNHDTGRQH